MVSRRNYSCFFDATVKNDQTSCARSLQENATAIFRARTRAAYCQQSAYGLLRRMLHVEERYDLTIQESYLWAVTRTFCCENLRLL